MMHEGFAYCDRDVTFYATDDTSRVSMVNSFLVSREIGASMLSQAEAG